MLVCIKVLWFQAGRLTGGYRVFQLETKLWIVLLWVNVTEIDKTGGVFCGGKNIFENICHMFGLFSHLQISGIWVNLASRAAQMLPKWNCCCWTETAMSTSQRNICVLTMAISKLTKSWLRKPHYGARKENDPTKTIQIPKLLTVRESWHC